MNRVALMKGVFFEPAFDPILATMDDVSLLADWVRDNPDQVPGSYPVFESDVKSDAIRQVSSPGLLRRRFRNIFGK